MGFKAGIIGCGGISRCHVDGYRANGAEVTAVTDVSAEAAEKLAGETGAAVYADVPALLASGVEVVSICTPPVAHEEAAIAALAAGVHVLCEKPMAFDAAAARRMVQAVAGAKAQFMPAFRHRFLPANIAFRKLIADGTLGDPVLFSNMFFGPAFGMEGKWFTNKAIAGGGCILDTSSHSVDLFRFLIGEIAEQTGAMHRHFKTTDVEDAGILTVKAVNGAVGAMYSAFVAGSGVACIDIVGTKGRAIYDYFESNKLKYKLTEDEDWREIAVTPSGGFDEQIAHFFGAIRGEHALTCTVHDGVRVMEVIGAVYEEQAAKVG
jgi:predicted dehydrogenase